MIKKRLLIFILIVLFFINIKFTEAAVYETGSSVEFTPQVSIGTEIEAGKSMEISGTSIAKYVVAIYNWALYVIVILAIVMIMVAGVRWMMAAGNASIVGQARDQIISSLIGLLIAIGSYALLNFINPALVRMREIDPGGIKNINIEFRKCADNEACVYDGKMNDNYDCVCKPTTRIYFNPGAGAIGQGLRKILGFKTTKVTTTFKSDKECGQIGFCDGCGGVTMGVKCLYGGDCVVNDSFYTEDNPLDVSAITRESFYNPSAAYCADPSLTR
jgi:hypothetical protein